MASRIGEVFGAEHDNETGGHTTITATGSGTFGGPGSFVGDLTATGDVKALTGTTEESGLGILPTVNSAAFEAAEVARWGLLVGGPTNGYWIELRAATSPYTAGYELALWLFSFSATIPIWRLGSIGGVPTWLNGSGGANVGLGLNSSGDRFASLAVNDLWVHNGLTEHDRAAKLGEWTTFTPTRTASAGTWTAGTVTTAQYMLVGKTMFMSFYITGTSVSNALVELRLAIPGGFTAAKDQITSMICNNAGAGNAAGAIIIGVGGTYLRLYESYVFAGFGISVTATDVYGCVSFEVQ